ncbi:hypothetical protein Gasu2_70260 [Galdieria sulphuraria]|uniref:Uncharacterized protein n=1 Tax=Galdieria sulphuraria TaxID=130081 RepID=M2W9H7_GALSU|nr:uncharacterized protein Gasu_03200 [Galdieria sulphuraria]EME32546.1 hypothetical protein Gasu_03200 [Galdieria sulphuraria]GJD12969.1 hypothetical protein Gasu2_70260 [Galdieria sulphuraria]|eukprot:XP_005709066.1 hypothetical protein Gasu_03200 [Galdieria sulphuraria]
MSERPHRSNVQYGAKQEATYCNLQQIDPSTQSFEEEYWKSKDSVVRARPIHSVQVSRESLNTSSPTFFPEEEAALLKRRQTETDIANSPIFKPIFAFTSSVLNILAKLKAASRTVDVKRIYSELFSVVINTVSDRKYLDVANVVHSLLKSSGVGEEHTIAFQNLFVNAILSVISLLNQLPPSEVTRYRIAQTIRDVDFVRHQGSLSGIEPNPEQPAQEALSRVEDTNSKKTMRTRSSVSGTRNLSSGFLEDYGNLYAEEDQDTAANFSVTGVNNNIVDGFTEELNALIPSLSGRLERRTRAARLVQWDQECLEVIATGLQRQLTNLIDRAKDVAVKRILESEIMSQLQENEKQDPRYELEEIRKEELRQIEAIVEANRRRNEEEEDLRESQQLDSSSKRKASDSPFESGENIKRSRKRHNAPSSASESLQKTNEALSSSIQGLLKKRREQARLSLMKQSGDTKTHSLPSHENISQTKRLFKTEPERRNVTVSIRDVIFVLERDVVCRKSTWFYNKYNSLRTLNSSER